MPLTLGNIRTEVKANLKNSSIANSRVDLWTNIAQEELWQVIDPEYGKETTTFTTTSGTRQYNVEASINKVLSIVDQTNDLRLSQTSETELERFDPDLDDSGTPYHYSTYGITYVNNQPSAASVITVVSSSDSDTTQTVQVVGTVSGVEDAETLTLNGITNKIGSKSFSALRRITKSATTVGNVTATSNAAAVTNVIIPSRRIFVEYQPIRLWPVPAGTYTVLVRYIRNPIPLRDATDIPDIPGIWHNALLQQTLVHGHRYLYEFDIANAKEAQVGKMLGNLITNQSTKRDYAPVIGKGLGYPGIGRLPSNYPR